MGVVFAWTKKKGIQFLRRGRYRGEEYRRFNKGTEVVKSTL